MYLSSYLGLIHHGETNLARAFREVASAHGDEPDVFHLCHTFAQQCQQHVRTLQPFVDRYGEKRETEPERLYSDLFKGTREGALALLRDLHDLYLMAQEVDLSWILIKQAAQGLQDRALVNAVGSCEGETQQQITWLKSRMKQAAPQTLIVAS